MELRDFLPADLVQLPRMNPDDLIHLERGLAREFRELSREYMRVRMVRIELMLAEITQALDRVAAGDTAWTEVYEQELATIAQLQTNFEDWCLAADPADAGVVELVAAYEQMLGEVAANLLLPASFDGVLRPLPPLPVKDEHGDTPHIDVPPFAHLFDSVFTPHKTQLAAIANEKRYQLQMLAANAEANTAIVWMQYYREMCRFRQQLVDDTYADLWRLHQQYHHVNYEHQRRLNHAQYYRAVVPPRDVVPEPCNTTQCTDARTAVAELRDPSYANRDNPYVARNKIATTDVRRDAARAALLYPLVDRPQGELAVCRGLSDDEIDADLRLMNPGALPTPAPPLLSPEPAQVEPESEVEAVESDVIEPDEPDEPDEEEDKPPCDEAQQRLRQLRREYRALLGLDRSPSPTATDRHSQPPLLPLPALEAFPTPST